MDTRHRWNQLGPENVTLVRLDVVQAGSAFSGFFSTDQLTEIIGHIDAGRSFKIEQYGQEKTAAICCWYNASAGGVLLKIQSIPRAANGVQLVKDLDARSADKPEITVLRQPTPERRTADRLDELAAVLEAATPGALSMAARLGGLVAHAEAMIPAPPPPEATDEKTPV